MATKTRTRRWTERRLERALHAMFARSDRVRSAGTFRDHGLLTRNRGIVVTFEDGSEFQIQVVDSTRRAR